MYTAGAVAARVYNGFAEWMRAAASRSGQTPARHHRLLATKLEAISSGKSDRLMIQMPPGSAKSTHASVLLPAWWFTQHPRDSVIAACHTAALAAHFGRRSRAVIAEEADSLGYRISSSDRSNAHWSTSGGGEYYAVGVRGAIIGRRADLVLIDDPVRSQREIDSSNQRGQLWEWYSSDLVPRLKPRGRIVLVMTRWHEDDLCGRLLEREAGQWDRVDLPAVAAAPDQLQRVPGEVLWPGWEDADVLARRRTTVGERSWCAQYQQSPRPDVGAIFKTQYIAIVDDPPDSSNGTIVRAWDLAATSATDGGDPDWTAGVKLMRHTTGKFTVLNVVRLRGSSRQVEEMIVSTARLDGQQVTIGLPMDPGQAGKSQISYLTGSLVGYRTVSSRETGPKLTRAGPVASQIEGGNVAVVRGLWNHAFLEELRDFPNGRKDDQVDALSRAFNMMVDSGHAAKTVQVNHMER